VVEADLPVPETGPAERRSRRPNGETGAAGEDEVPRVPHRHDGARPQRTAGALLAPGQTLRAQAGGRRGRPRGPGPCGGGSSRAICPCGTVLTELASRADRAREIVGCDRVGTSSVGRTGFRSTGARARRAGGDPLRREARTNVARSPAVPRTNARSAARKRPGLPAAQEILTTGEQWSELEGLRTRGRGRRPRPAAATSSFTKWPMVAGEITASAGERRLLRGINSELDAAHRAGESARLDHLYAAEQQWDRLAQLPRTRLPGVGGDERLDLERS